MRKISATTKSGKKIVGFWSDSLSECKQYCENKKKKGYWKNYRITNVTDYYNTGR